MTSWGIVFTPLRPARSIRRGEEEVGRGGGVESEALVTRHLRFIRTGFCKHEYALRL